MTKHSKERTPAGRPSGGGGQAKVLSPEEIARVEKCLTGTRTELRDRALWCLQYATGMRAGELAALNVGDVLHRGAICHEFRLGTEDTKYCKARTIFLESPKAINALLAYLRQRNPALTFTGAEPLFTGARRSCGRHRPAPTSNT